MRTIFHIESHTYRGVKITAVGLGYESKIGKNYLFATKWWRVEEMIDEIKGKN